MPNSLFRTVVITVLITGSLSEAGAQSDSLRSVFKDQSLSDSLRADALFQLGASLPPDSAIASARQLERFGIEHDYEPAKALAYRSLAYKYYKLGKSDSSEYYYNACAEIAERHSMLETLSKIYFNKIWLTYQTGEYYKGVDAAKKAIEVRSKLNDQAGLAQAYQQLGQVLGMQGESVKALKAIQQSLLIAEEIDDTYLKALANGILGNLYNRQGETEKAIEYTKENIRLMETMGNKKGMSVGYGNLAGMYQFLGRTDEADDADSKALKLAEELGDMQSVGISYINIGQKKVMRGEHESGLEQIKEGHSMLAEHGAVWPYNSSMKMMGLAYQEMGKHRDAISWCMKAVEHAREKKLDQMLLDDLKCAYQSYEELKDFANALKYYREYKLLEDSLYSESKAKELASQETRFDYEKKLMADSLAFAKEQEMSAMKIAAQEAQLESEQTQRFALYGGLGLLLLFGGAMYNRFQVTRKQRDTIDEQKAEVESQRDEIQTQHQQLEEKNKEILDSIAYAKRIQTAILPPDRIVKEYLQNSFILYKPKDVVAGDFYWMESVSYSPPSQGGVPEGESIYNSPPSQGGVPEGGGGSLNNHPHLKYFRKQLRNSLTPAEAKLWNLLSGKKLDGRKFRRQHSIGDYILDFYCPSEKLAIELDGEVHNNVVSAEYDAERTAFLNAYGIKVLRFENDSVFQQPDMLLESIKSNFSWEEKEPPRPPEADTPPSKGGEEEVIFFAAADCTGHGVPGAMVSVICNNGLNRSVREFGLREPGEILDKTRELVIQEFEKSEEEVKDGMDISLCALNTKTRELKWAGANNPLWIVQRSEIKDQSQGDLGLGSLDLKLHEVQANKQPIGKYDLAEPFTTHTIQLKEGDTIYIFSDGYPDQFGGDNGKKYKSGKFKRTLLDLAQKPISEQREWLDQEFESWRGSLEQIDDVCVIGVKV